MRTFPIAPNVAIIDMNGHEICNACYVEAPSPSLQANE